MIDATSRRTPSGELRSPSGLGTRPPTAPSERRRSPVGPALLTVVLFGSAFPATKAGLVDYGPGALALLRFAVASVAIALFVASRRIALPPLRAAPQLAAVGLMLVTGYHVLFNHGQRLLSASAASVLVNTGPVWTAIVASIVLRERPGALLWVGLALSFTGAAFLAVANGGQLDGGLGALLVLGAAVLQGSAFVFQKPLATRYHPLGVAAMSVWAGTLALAALFGGELFGAVAHASRASTAAALFLGLGSSAVGLISWAYVLSRVPASQAAPFLLLVPVVATTIAILWLNEIPDALTLVGGVVTVAGVVVAQRAKVVEGAK